MWWVLWQAGRRAGGRAGGQAGRQAGRQPGRQVDEILNFFIFSLLTFSQRLAKVQCYYRVTNVFCQLSWL